MSIFLFTALNEMFKKESSRATKTNPEPAMNTSITADQIIDQIDATRAAYGWPPLTAEQYKAAVEERRCDQIAEMWVRYHGGPNVWKGALPMIREGFTNRQGCTVELLGIVDTWEEDFDLTLADFDRLQSEIFGCIVAHARACAGIREIKILRRMECS